MEQKVEMGPFERFKVGSGTPCKMTNPGLCNDTKTKDVRCLFCISTFCSINLYMVCSLKFHQFENNLSVAFFTNDKKIQDGRQK